MSAVLLPQGKQQYFTAAGVPLVGGKVYTTDTGTSTPRTTWSDAAQTAPNTNPVILDARGEATIFWSGAYRVRVEDSLGNTIWTVDGVSDLAYGAGLRLDLASFTDGAKGAGLVGFSATVSYTANTIGAFIQTIYKRTAAEIAASVTPTLYYFLPGDIRRYGASTASANNAAAIQAAISQAQQSNGDPVRVPYGTYDVQAALTISTNYVSIIGDDVIRSIIRKVGNFDLLTISGGAHALLDRVSYSSSGGVDVSRGIVINTTGHVSMPNLRVSSHGSHGIEVLQGNQLNFGDVVSTSNLGDGLKMTGSGGIQANACTFVNFNSSANTGMGARFLTAKNNVGFIACQGNVAGGFEFSTCFGNAITIYAESNTGADLTFTAACVAPNFGGNFVTVAFSEDAPTFAGTSAATNVVLCLKPGPTFQPIHNTLRADQFVLTNQKTDGTAPTGTLTFSHTANGVYTLQAGSLASAQSIVMSNTDPGGIDFITDRVRAQWLLASAAAPAGGAGQTIFGATHATTVGAAGGATALPATPLGYLIANVDGTQVKIPYYNN